MHGIAAPALNRHAGTLSRRESHRSTGMEYALGYKKGIRIEPIRIRAGIEVPVKYTSYTWRFSKTENQISIIF